MRFLNLLIKTIVWGGVSVSLAFANTGGVRLDHAPIDHYDNASLQRGAKLFANYCLNCHGAQYMRYNRLRDIGLTEDQIKDNLIFSASKVGDTMVVSLPKEDGKKWFGAVPPDLSVTARSRGADWLYTYLRSFYRDTSKVTGWNNLVFPSVGMPHVLWELGGQMRLEKREISSHEEAEALLLQERGVAELVEVTSQKESGTESKSYLLRTLAVAEPGKLTVSQYDEAIKDLVNYLVFVAEPIRNQRVQWGILALLVLGAFFFLAYSLKKEYWKDVH